ncbi:MAG: RtcB family protein [Lentisphaerae bacterium]|nr:RtcB family protein [Lentisphaerota bacterium]MCP4101641.1 RtcB family protein [Lentisphaerota bacterium]
MKWIKEIEGGVPVKSWCEQVEPGAMTQAVNLAHHPATFRHVALMPDCHVGYGMPIGGVIACENAVIPNAVGVDIGCGMVAVETDCPADKLKEIKDRRLILNAVKTMIPVGEAHSHQQERDWKGFSAYQKNLQPGVSYPWPAQLDRKNLGTLGGGNHFIELQTSEDGMIWLMIHSGSRNLGYKIASHYHKLAQHLNAKMHCELPCKDLAFLPADSEPGMAYIRDMNFALDYALENRHRMMASFKQAFEDFIGTVEFKREVNIHHNYAALETHFDKDVWVHRKGATSAKLGEVGIIPGSMGTPSYIAEGLGNPESFMSCSHGAGRKMGRNQAVKTLPVEDCDKAMTGIAYDRWSPFKAKWNKKNKGKYLDLSEAPLAYKDIEEVIEAELDLIKPLVKLYPIGVVKG